MVKNRVFLSEYSLFVKSTYKKAYLPQNFLQSYLLRIKGYAMIQKYNQYLYFKTEELKQDYLNRLEKEKDSAKLLGEFLGYPKEACEVFSEELNSSDLFEDRLLVKINGLNFISYLRCLQKDLHYLENNGFLFEDIKIKITYPKLELQYILYLNEFYMENDFKNLVEEIGNSDY